MTPPLNADRRTFLKAAGLATLGFPAIQALGANETLNVGLHRHRRALPAPA